ncbi:MAG: lysylphosphatidylglycerol synthase transmembrane domain-containing protein [Chitinophagales bacterium]
MSLSNQQVSSEALETLNPNKVILPILLSVAIVVFLFVKDFEFGAFNNIQWSLGTAFWFSMAVLCVVVRHFALMYRIKLLTGNKLSWKQSFDIISLWEFGSAVTPSVVGGTAISLFLITKEKISGGETLSVILSTLFLDGLFFLVGIPFLWMILGSTLLTPTHDGQIAVSSAWMYSFILAYGVMVVYTASIGYGLFISPKSFKWLLIKVTKLPFFNRWSEKAVQIGNDMIIASNGLRGKKISFWAGSMGATFASWGLRFLILNCVLLGLTTVGSQLLLFGRQLIIFILMILAPTPGGSGVAEGSVHSLLSDFFLNGTGQVDDGLRLIVITVWRFISYMLYLFLGMIVLRYWLKRVMGNKES